MACSSYRIVNNSDKPIYFDYQRCDNSMWEYQVPVPVGQSSNFWAFEGTVRYPKFYNDLIEFQELNDAPPTDIEYLPPPPPINGPPNCTQWTISNPSEKSVNLQYYDCDGEYSTSRIRSKGTVILCASYLFDIINNPLLIASTYNPPNPCCTDCDPCYSWTAFTSTQCFSQLSLPAIPPSFAINLQSSTSNYFSEKGTRFFGELDGTSGNGIILYTRNNPPVWAPPKYSSQYTGCLNPGILVDGQTITLELEEGLSWSPGDFISLIKQTTSFNSIFGFVSSYNKNTGILVFTVDESFGVNELICDWFVYAPYIPLGGPMNRCALSTNFTAVGDWLGFSICLPVSNETVTYYLGLGAEPYFRVVLDSVVLLDNSDNENQDFYEYWNVYPVTVPPGVHVLQVFGRGEGIREGFGFELYNNTLEELISALNVGDLNIIFTTNGKTQAEIVSTSSGLPNNFGYTCETGYIYSNCDGKCIKTMECIKPPLTPVNLVYFFDTNNDCDSWGDDKINIQDYNTISFQTAVNYTLAMCIDISCNICPYTGTIFTNISYISAEYSEKNGQLQFFEKDNVFPLTCTPPQEGNYLIVPSSVTNGELFKSWWCNNNTKRVVRINETGVSENIQTLNCNQNYSTFRLKYSIINQDIVCDITTGTTTTYYTYFTTGITEGTVIYKDIGRTILADDGYYAGRNLTGIVVDELEGFRIVSGGVVSDIVSCINTFQLNYNSINDTEACLGFNISCEDCYYYTLSTYTGITDGMVLYTDVSLETLAPAGYYAGGPLPIVVDEVDGFRIVSAGTVSNIVNCPSPTPTNTPTVTPTPSATSPQPTPSPTPTNTPTVTPTPSTTSPQPTPSPTPTNTPTVTPTPSTTSPEPTSTPTPSPTPECLIVTSSSGVTLSQCSGDTDRIYVNGWQTGVTFTITTSAAVSFSGNQVSLGGSVTESGLSLTSLDVTVNSIGGISESVFIECTQTTEDVYLYYQIAIIPTALDCPQKILEIYYLVP